jgi:hypothetical protein
VHFQGLTDPSTQNEDWLACSSDMIVVLDGATVRTETGCVHGPAWFSRKLGAAIISHAASRSQSLTSVLSDAIRDVAALHVDTCDLADPAAPSAAVGIIRVEGDTTRYLVLGDITIVADVRGEVAAISDDRVSHTALKERHEADRHPIGSPEKTQALQRMKEVELAAKNTAGGYWIAGSEPDAATHAIVGEWKTSELARAAMMSDGAARFVNLFQLGDWKSVLNVLKVNGPARLIEDVRKAEHRDSNGTRYPRNKRSDDATVVYAVPEPNIETEPYSPSPEARKAAMETTIFPEGLMGAEPVDPAWLARAQERRLRR